MFGTTVWAKWVFGTSCLEPSCGPWDQLFFFDHVWDHCLEPCLGPSFGTMGVWDPPFLFGTMGCLGPTIWDHACLGPWFGTMGVWDQLFGTIPFGTIVWDQNHGCLFRLGSPFGDHVCLGPHNGPIWEPCVWEQLFWTTVWHDQLFGTHHECLGPWVFGTSCLGPYRLGPSYLGLFRLELPFGTMGVWDVWDHGWDHLGVWDHRLEDQLFGWTMEPAVWDLGPGV